MESMACISQRYFQISPSPSWRRIEECPLYNAGLTEGECLWNLSGLSFATKGIEEVNIDNISQENGYRVPAQSQEGLSLQPVGKTHDGYSRHDNRNNPCSNMIKGNMSEERTFFIKDIVNGQYENVKDVASKEVGYSQIGRSYL